MYFVLLFASRYKNRKQRGEACSGARTGGFLGLGKEGSMFKFTVMSSFLFRVLTNDPYLNDNLQACILRECDSLIILGM